MNREVRDGLLSGYLRTVRFKKAIPHIIGKRLLDIGCDQGYIIPYLDKEIEYVGIERDPILIDKAKKKFPGRWFYQTEITQENIKAIGIGNFDTILMTAVIEHMKEPIKIVELLSSILCKKGRIIITSPSRNSHALLSILSFFRLLRNDKDEHEYYVDSKMMSRLFDSGSYKLLLYKKFQLGLNQLYVLEKA